MRFVVRSFAAFVLGFLGLSGCADDATSTSSGGGGSSSSGPACTLPFAGDEGQEPVLEAFFLDINDADQPIADGSVLDLIEPPQGGRVAFVGARVFNMSPCGAQLTAEIKDPVSGAVRFETRSVALEPDADGYLTIKAGQIAAYSNVPLCFNTWSDQSLFDGDFVLEVRVESEGRVAKANFNITMQCTDKSLADNTATPEPGAVLNNCLCTCKADYVLGEPCDSSMGGSGAGGGQ